MALEGNVVNDDTEVVLADGNIFVFDAAVALVEVSQSEYEKIFILG